MELKHMDGRNAGHIVIYALSTCPWCKKVKSLLDDLGVEYYFADVDLMADAEKERAMETVKKWNSACSFPTMVIDDSRCIVGFKEDEIRGMLKL